MTTKTEASAASPVGARTESFKEEVRSLKIKDSNAGRDTLFVRLGLAAMLVGVVVSVIGYFVSHGTNNLLTQNDSLTIGMIGIAVTIAGGAVFLRYSLAGFLRFWLARFIFEQQKGRD
jgi:hypothetical protein